MNSITGLSPQLLRRAADLKERIDALQNELNTLLNGSNATHGAAAPTRTGRRQRKLSPTGRERIAAAARERWAKLRAARQATAPVKKAKRHFSPEARARLAALAKERWAKAKRSGKGRL